MQKIIKFAKLEKSMGIVPVNNRFTQKMSLHVCATDSTYKLAKCQLFRQLLHISGSKMILERNAFELVMVQIQ